MKNKALQTSKIIPFFSDETDIIDQNINKLTRVIPKKPSNATKPAFWPLPIGLCLIYSLGVDKAHDLTERDPVERSHPVAEKLQERV